MLESIRSGNSPRYQSTSVIPTSSDTWGHVKTFFRIAVPQRRAAKHLGHTWYIGKSFCKSVCIFISTLSSRIESMEFVKWGAAPFIHSGEKWKARTRSEMPVWTVSQKFSHLQWRRLFKELWGRQTTTAGFGSSLWQVPYTSDLCLLEDEVQGPRYVLVHNFLRKQCSGSKKWSWLIQWTIWDLRHLLVVFQCLILKYSMRGLLQPWTRSSIIPISKGRSVWRNKRPRKRTVSFEVDRLPTWSTNNSGSLEPIVLFEMTIFRNPIRSVTEYYCPMTKIPHDDILEGLYKLRIRESDKLKTVLELYDLETHQKKLGPDYHRLKAMVKRSIEQEIRNKNFEARSGKFEKNAVVKNPGSKPANQDRWLETLGKRRKILRNLKKMIDREKNGMVRLLQELKKGIRAEVV